MTAGKKKTSVNPRLPGVRVMEPPSESGPSPDSNTTRASRQQEKEQLSGLNDRLASYIERVRNLEMENQSLHVKLHEVEEVDRHERSETVGRYEGRVEDLRGRLDALAKEKIKLEIERGNAVVNVESLRDRLAKTERDMKFIQTESNHRFEQLQDVTGRLNSAENVNANLIREIMELRGEFEASHNEATALRRQLEDAQVRVTELERHVAAYKDELDSNKRAHVKEVDDLRRKRQSEIMSVSAEVETLYQTKLQEQLRALRDDFDQRSADNREELAALYANKIRDYESQLENLHETVRELKGTNDKLISDYQDLLDLKVQLDTELQAYQKLLESEERRLNIPLSRTPVVDQGDRRGVKRRRMDGSYPYQSTRGVKKVAKKVSDAHGSVVIEDVDVKGAYIRLKNQDEEDVPVGGWVIRAIGSDKEIVFKFHTRQVIRGGRTMTVWSADAEHEHSPPTHVVMKNQVWPSDAKVRLVDDKEVQQAFHEVTFEWIEADDEGEDGDDATTSQENCTLM